MDRENDLARLPAIILIPSFGLAMLFGLGALGSFTPKNGMPFIRSLMVISAATLIAVLVTRPRVARRTVDPNAWMETAIPLAVALISTLVILTYNQLTVSQKDDNGLNP